MKERTILLLIALTALCAFSGSLDADAQIIDSYSSSDRPYSAVFDVEDMNQYEIKGYNQLLGSGATPNQALLCINSSRAMDNLKAAPPIIIDYSFSIANEDDSVGEPGQVLIGLCLINSTVKTIKNAVLTFSFFNDVDCQMYDIHTGNPNCVISYKNLVGRKNTDYYEDMFDASYIALHVFGANEGQYIQKFINKKVTQCRLVKANITFTDGSKPKQIAIFHNVLDEDLLSNGPLEPIVSCVNKIKVSKEIEDENHSEEKIYDVVESMPSFPGGSGAMLAWISKNLCYPASAALENVQGRVIVSFVVERDGSLTDIHTVRSVDPALDREAEKVVSKMPRWTPGVQNGQRVRVRYNIPVTFR